MMFRSLPSLMLLLSLGLFNTATAADPPVKPRVLAPGVLTTINPEPEAGETFAGPISMIEVVGGFDGLDWQPNYGPKTDTLLEMAKRVTFRRQVWNLEFAFKPLRRLDVDLPQAEGRMKRKQIWYMVYRVKNIGGDLRPVAKPSEITDDVPKADNPDVAPTRSTIDTEIGETADLRFIPHFVLSGKVLENDKYGTKDYLDRILPAAQAAIEARETPGQKLLNTVAMTKVKIPLSDARNDRSVWGVVTWEDIDPRIDFLSIYVQGLTNAYKFQDEPGGFKKGALPTSGRTFAYKTLQLNFWRAGDSIDEHEEELRYGVPLDEELAVQIDLLKHYNVEKPLAHVWLYR